ncbi:tautomerase-like protein [Rhizobium sp. BK418]|nr:tautomerase-like protein [Rhizobium sp. BK418]
MDELGELRKRHGSFAGVSNVLLEVLNKPLAPTFVVIEEVGLENWGWGGYR